MLSFQDLMQPSGNANSEDFFKLKPAEEVQVRFVYNSMDDFQGYLVHEFTCAGRQPVRIACPNDGTGEASECKYCEQGIPKMQRVYLAIYRLDTNKIQYWVKTAQWFKNEFVPIISEVPTGVPCSQVYKIKRTGEGLKTSYTIIPVGQPDNTKAESLGIIRDAINDVKAFRTVDYQIPMGFVPYMGTSGQQQNNQGYNTNYNNTNYNPNYNQGGYQQPQPFNTGTFGNPQYTEQPNNYSGPQYTGQQATRRTTEMF